MLALCNARYKKGRGARSLAVPVPLDMGISVVRGSSFFFVWCVWKFRFDDTLIGTENCNGTMYFSQINYLFRKSNH